MTVELTEKEYKGTMTSKMIDVTKAGDASVDIWPYVRQLIKNNVVLDYVYEKQLVEVVYRNDQNTFDHVLIPTNDKNAFVVIIVDIGRKTIKGHYLLNLNKEYGLQPKAKNSLKQYELKSGLLDRSRKLVLTEEYVEFENKDLKGQEFTRFNKADIIDFKHGMDWIVWYKFTVGRQFSITFKDNRNKELKIVFKSYFGLNKHYHEMYSDIVDDIWRYYNQDIVDKYLDRFYNNEELSLQGLKLNQTGIQLVRNSSILPWDRVEMKEYYRYFAICDKNQPEIHSRVGYNEYETEILWSVMKTILKEKQVA